MPAALNYTKYWQVVTKDSLKVNIFHQLIENIMNFVHSQLAVASFCIIE